MVEQRVVERSDIKPIHMTLTILVKQIQARSIHLRLQVRSQTAVCHNVLITPKHWSDNVSPDLLIPKLRVFSPLRSGERGIVLLRMCLLSLITHYERWTVRIYWRYTAWRGMVLWDAEPKELGKTLTRLRYWLGGLQAHIFVQDCAPSVVGCGNDGGLDRSPRKRSDVERWKSPGPRTGMRLSSLLLLRLPPPVSPQTTPFILSITKTGTTLKYGDNTTGSVLHRSTWHILGSGSKAT